MSEKKPRKEKSIITEKSLNYLSKKRIEDLVKYGDNLNLCSEDFDSSLIWKKYIALYSRLYNFLLSVNETTPIFNLKEGMDQDELLKEAEKYFNYSKGLKVDFEKREKFNHREI